MWCPAMSHRPLLIMAGGTGGHVYPALAVADYLRAEGFPVLWLGTRNGLEYKVVPDKGYRLLTIDIWGVRGKTIGRWILAPILLIRAIFQAVLILLRIKPAAALGMGGFASAPGGIAAWLLRIPLLIHEQNSVAGTANRLLLPMAKIVMQGFPGTFQQSHKVHSTGNPVRPEIITAAEKNYRTGFSHDGKFNLLILGGSQGAKTLNEIIPPALSRMRDTIDVSIWHQTGERHFPEVKALYEKLGGLIDIRIDAFINDMGKAYSWADLVLCRSGAMTIAELCVSGVASILVPYPFAIDDHQTVNARYLSDRGCALLIPESELDDARLANSICEIFNTPGRLLEMSTLTKQQAAPWSTRDVAELCMGFMR